jgi:hypothetical protein
VHNTASALQITIVVVALLWKSPISYLHLPLRAAGVCMFLLPVRQLSYLNVRRAVLGCRLRLPHARLDSTTTLKRCANCTCQTAH